MDREVSSFGRIDTDVEQGFGGLEKVDSSLCSCNRATENIRIVYELSWWLGE